MPSSLQQPEPLLILADDRETSGGCVEALRALDGVEVRVARLPLGDYDVDGRLLFERKTLPDFVASIKDGRLFRQARRLASSRRRGVILLEGTSRELEGSGMTREAIQGALISLSLIFGLPLLRSMSAEESARLMVYAGRQVREVISGGLPRKGIRPAGRRKTQLAILQGLPGIGPGRAGKLLDAFGSVEAVVAASAERLRATPGVGARTADAIRWAVGEAAAEYRPADAPADEDAEL